MCQFRPDPAQNPPEISGSASLDAIYPESDPEPSLFQNMDQDPTRNTRIQIRPENTRILGANYPVGYIYYMILKKFKFQRIRIKNTRILGASCPVVYLLYPLCQHDWTKATSNPFPLLDIHQKYVRKFHIFSKVRNFFFVASP